MPVLRSHPPALTRAATALLVCCALLAACGGGGSSPQPTRLVSLSDNFHRADGDIDGQPSPSKQPYLLQHDQGGTGLEISDNRLVRARPAAYGANGSPILIWPLRTDPVVVTSRFVFEPGRTRFQDVVVGACQDGFGRSSIQLAVSPTSWKLLYTLVRAEEGTGTEINVIAQGQLPSMLSTDGRTVYEEAIRVDLAASSATVSYPGGSQVVSNPVISKYWGKRMGVQIRRPNSTDGDAQVVSITAQLPARH